MRKKRKQLLLMGLLLSLAMVFTMMPALVWAADEPEDVYYVSTDQLTDGGEYVLAVEDEDGWHAITGVESRDGSGVLFDVDAQLVEVNATGQVLTNPEGLTVWKYANSEGGGSSVLYNDYGHMYFCSDGIKYQIQGYRSCQYDASTGRLYTHSTDGTTSGCDINVVFKDGQFTTFVDRGSANPEFSVVTLFEKPADPLEAIKTLAKEEVESVNIEDYTGNARTAMKLVIGIAEAGIESAETVDAVTDILEAFREACATIPTNEAKATVKGEIDDAVDPEDYSGECKEMVEDAIAEAKAAVDDATSVESFDGIMEDLEDAIADIPTDAMKDAAQDVIDDVDPEDYDGKAKEAVEGWIDVAEEAIDDATSIEDLEDLLDNFERLIDAIPTTADKAEAKAEIIDKDPANYDGTAKALIEEAIDTAEKAIDDATNKDEFQIIQDDFDKEVKNIPTTADKTQAKQALNIKIDDYDGPAKELVADALAKANAKIDAATDKAAFEVITNEFNEAVANVPTNNDKANAIANVKKWVDPEVLKKYDPDQQKEIEAYVVSAVEEINKSTDVRQIVIIVEKADEAIATLPTTEQKAAIATTAVKIKSVKAKKKKMIAKWDPKTDVFDGYQVKYRVKKKGSWKTKSVNNPKAYKKVIKKLKKGKKYQVKVRGYKLYGEKHDITVYGKYSKTKTSKKIK